MVKWILEKQQYLGNAEVVLGVQRMLDFGSRRFPLIGPRRDLTIDRSNLAFAQARSRHNRHLHALP